MDSSSSLGFDIYKKQLDFLQTLVSKSDVDSGSVRVGALSFSTGVSIGFHLNEYSTKGDIMRAIGNISYIYGSTNMADALKILRKEMFTTKNGDRPEINNIALFLTDGISNINSRQTVPQAQLAKEDGITIYGVGIGLTDLRELEAIASSPKEEHVFLIDNFDQLYGLHTKIFTTICPGKVL